MTEQEAHLAVTEQDGVSIVRFTSPTLLDAYHVGVVGKELMSLIENDGLRRIALDLASIKMISSQALGVMLTARHRLIELGGKIAICGVDPKLYRVFRVTNLQDMFDFYDSADAAAADWKD